MEAKFSLLPRPDEDFSTVRRSSRGKIWSVSYILLLALSLVLNVALVTRHQWNDDSQPPRGRYAKTMALEKVWKRFYWHTKWVGPNQTETDWLWDRVMPSHGFVAIDRRSAAASGWPESMYLPSDHSKGVYLIEAYHQLHCLKIVRQTFHEAVSRQPYTCNPHHAEHCFDALRQSVVCNADNTPLYTFGDRTAGDGQIHRCRSWEQLRNWATKNSARYRDSVETIPLGDHFAYCDDGYDGIEVDDLMTVFAG